MDSFIVAEKDEFAANIRKKFGQVCFWENGSWLLLPGWARFYMELGSLFSLVERNERRFVIALAVPTRAYVSLLFAAGAVITRAAIPSGHSDTADHLLRLKSLEKGTPVVLRNPGRKLRGRFAGYVRNMGRLLFGVQIEEGNNTIRYIPSADAYRIDILDVEDVRLPTHQKGYEIAPPSPLVEPFFSQERLAKFSQKSQQDCVVVGTINILEEEIGTAALAYKLDNSSYAKGDLKDILRPRQLLKTGAASRANFLPASSRHIPKFATALSPYITIFDGATGFVKWQSYWRASNWIIILDRTERNFAEASTLINQEYIQHHVENRQPVAIPTTPPGVEVMVFEELR